MARWSKHAERVWRHEASGVRRCRHPGMLWFFVISGFLITSLLMSEREKTGATSLKRCRLRRKVRIFAPPYAIRTWLEHFRLALPNKVQTRNGVRPWSRLSGDGRLAPLIAGYNLLASSPHTPPQNIPAVMLASARIDNLSRLSGGNNSDRWWGLPSFHEGLGEVSKVLAPPIL
jgi:hypothetical protein